MPDRLLLLNAGLSDLPETLLSEKTTIQNCGFVLFAVCFFIIAYALSRNIGLIRSMIDELFRKKEKRSFSPQLVQYEFVTKLLLTFMALLLWSIAIALIAAHRLEWEIALSQFLKSLLIAFVSILGFLIYKLLTTNIIGSIFFKKEQLQQWNNNFTSVLSLNGLILFLPAIVMFYADRLFVVCFYLLLFCFIFLFSLVIYRTYVIFFAQKRALLYFILYLCAQEIIPLYLLCRGMFYMFRFAQKDALWMVIV